MNNYGKEFTEQTNSENESQFNEALRQLLRIGNLWDSCHYFRKRANLQQWNVSLDCVWMELIEDSTPENETDIVNVNKEYLENKSQRNLIYQILMKKETILRKIQKKQGKGGKKKTDKRGL